MLRIYRTKYNDLSVFIFIIQDPVAEITALAKYLNQDLSTELIDDIAERTQFEKMKSGKYESEAIIREVYHKEDATLFRKGKYNRN